MCGLFGYQLADDTVFTVPERTLLAYALGNGAQSRGRHACGYAAYVSSENNIVLHKEDDEFVGSTVMREVGLYSNVIGHTRYATVGARIVQNAHPFEYKHVVGAHNGGIYNHDTIATVYPDRSFAVDSQHLIAHIADGCDFSELRGYGAVTWYDTRSPGVTYLCRMRGGDLEAELLPDDKGIVWASTRAILASGLGLLNLYRASKSYTLEETRIYRVEHGLIEDTGLCIVLGQRVVPVASVPTPTPVTPSTTTVTSVKRPRRSLPRGKRSITVRTVPKSTLYKSGVMHWQSGRSSNQEPLEGLVGLIDERFWLSDADVNLLADCVDGMTRRKRRKYEGMAKTIQNHKTDCPCTACTEITLLLVRLFEMADAFTADGLLQ